MLGLFPTLQSRIDHFSKSSTGIAVRRCFNKSFYFTKCHWPRLLIGFVCLRSIPTIISCFQDLGPIVYQCWLEWPPQTRFDWAVVKMMTAAFACFVVDPLVHFLFIIRARPNPSHLPPQTSSSTTPSLTNTDLAQDDEPLTLSKVTSILNKNTPASKTSPYIFRIGQGLFLEWCAVAWLDIRSVIWELTYDEPFFDVTRTFFNLGGIDAPVPNPETVDWLWLEEGWVCVEMLAFGYALWVLLKDLKGVKREGWGWETEKAKDQEKLEEVESSDKSTLDM